MKIEWMTMFIQAKSYAWDLFGSNATHSSANLSTAPRLAGSKIRSPEMQIFDDGIREEEFWK